ncbi:DUF1420 family protein [Candidatus Pelagibacter sp. HIMB1748]|uniref:DUF1420 family protein n=1 Tax=unclassified Candidatus Pelagibacter TaxID=2647897 RepID=UPI003F826FFA
MENFILSPIQSTIISVLLLSGCYEFGKFISSKVKLQDTLSKVSILEFQYCSIGIVFLLIILFPITAFTDFSKEAFKITAIFLLFLGVKFLFFLKKNFKKILIKLKQNKDFFFYTALFLFVLYFFLALAPLTAADVLDYHSGVALNILRFGKYLLFPEWFTGLQAGTGEVLISLGFSIGSEQFGSLVQFVSIISITGIIIKKFDKNYIFSSKYLIVSIILTCPILIFLLSGNKPQIFFSSLIFLALSMGFSKIHSQNQFIKTFLIINILLCTSVMGKFSFGLSAFLVWIVSAINLINKKNCKFIILIPVLVFLFQFFPFLLWKIENLGGTLINYVFSPFPLHLPGYENFLNHNKGSQEIPFPKFLIYTSLSRATEFLGLNTLLIIFLLLNFYKNKNIFSIFIISFLFITFSNLYASPSARYYLDPILWSVLGISFLKNIKLSKFFEYLFYPQILAVIIILLYSNYIFLPGALMKENYLKVKNNYAYMYSGISWANKNIPDEARVIIINRPIANYKDFAVSGGFNYFTNSEEAKYYKQLIKNYKIDYLVYLGNAPDLMHLKNCVGEIYKFKENVGFHATRNPFNKGSYYNAYIFEFENNKLDKC